MTQIGLEFLGTPRFELRRRIGTGGMGVVYEAHDLDRDVAVALKTLPSPSGKALLRLKNEFRALQDLHHPNVVRYGELIEASGQWFFTMELVDGVDFSTYVRCSDINVDHGNTPPYGLDVTTMAESGVIAGPLPELDIPLDENEPTDVVPVSARDSSTLGDTHDALPAADIEVVREARLRASLEQMARALNALHHAGMVHRDIKPNNVLIDRRGRVVLLDLGLVTGAEPSEQSIDGNVVGTVAYMAPEQAAGGAIGPATDWYAMGVMLYQALTNKLPFRGTVFEVLADKQNFEPEPPRALRPDAPVDLDALCMKLLRTKPEDRPSGSEILALLGAAEAEGEDTRERLDTLHPDSFVGRAAELAALREQFTRARDGESVIVLVVGDSGVGKTALVRRFVRTREREEPRVVVLGGRCYERESVPYKAFDGVIDALGRFMRRLPDVDAGALIPRDAGLLGQVFPVLRQVEAIARAPAVSADLDPTELRSRLFAAIRELFLRLSDRRPVIVTIDDLQWADVDSLSILGELSRQPGAPALLLLATARPFEPDSAAARRTPRTAHELSLGPLPIDEAATLASSLLRTEGATAADAAALAEEAGGHPLFIRELARYRQTINTGAPAQDTTPLAIRLDDALLARVRALAPEARLVVERVAVAGAPLPQSVIARSTELAPDVFSGCVSQLRADHLVKTKGARPQDGIEPYHDRVREAVINALPDPERADHHRALAIVLERSGDIGDPEILATHWRGAGEPRRAAIHVARAADAAEAAYAFDRAAELLFTAMRLLPDDQPAPRDMRIRLGHMLANAGRGAEAAEVFVELARDDDTEAALYFKRLALEHYLRGGRFDEGFALVREVLDAIDLRLPERPRRLQLSLAVLYARLRIRGVDFVPRDEAEIPPDELMRLDLAWALARMVTTVDTVYGGVLEARTQLLALHAGEPRRVARSLVFTGLWDVAPSGKLGARLARILAKARELATTSEDPETVAWVATGTGVSRWFAGQFREALALLEESERNLREHCRDKVWERALADTWAAWTLYYLGELALLDQRVSRWRRAAVERDDLLAMSYFQTGIASMARLVRGEAELALRESNNVVARWSRSGYYTQHYWALITAVQSALYQGDFGRARTLMTDAWSDLDGSSLLYIVLFRVESLDLRARALLGVALGLTDDRERQGLVRRLEKDSAKMIAHEHPWATPLGRLIAAQVANLCGRADDAAEQYEAAIADFEAADMALHAAVARRRLGELRGGEAGDELIREADRWLRAQELSEPDRWVAMLAPVPGAFVPAS